VALLNILGKLLELIITTRLLYILEEHGLLPTTHLGGHKLISVDHAIQQVIKAIRGGWGRGLKVSMLLMDISGAYNNVAHERLVNNIRRLGLG
jgi:predicted HD phosphohydrolase